MAPAARLGVFLCYRGASAPGGFDLQQLLAFAKGLPQVVVARDLGRLPSLDPLKLAAEFKQLRLDGVVIAADSPGFFKPAFTRALAESGGDTEKVQLASLQAHSAYLGNEFDRAKALLLAAVHAVPFELAAVPHATEVHPDTLVIGAGVAGIQAALEIANAGKKVYLIEKSPTIGGHMAMFDKTFPTLDCAACILTPKMVAVAQHPNIVLKTLSEVEEVQGTPGAYRVRVREKARYVDVQTCIACNACTDICPVAVESEFDHRITSRKAIFIPFPQAVPNSFVLDAEHCTYILSDGKKCGACLKKCAKEAIHFDDEDRIVELEVGHIVVATGYRTFDAARIDRYGYGKHPNVLTALEFERLTNASGPTGGQIVLKTLKHNKRSKRDEWVFAQDGPRPKRVAIVHCVGSRDQNHNPYCSRVCCMYSLKFAHLVKEKLPDCECFEYYIDMRAFGKGYEEFFERIKDERVFVVRGRTAKVEEVNGQLTLRGEDILSDQVLEIPVDMVILSVGLEPADAARDLAARLGIRTDEYGWYTEADYNGDTTGTQRGGILLAGVCQGPKDIPDAVAQASAVAARVLRGIVSHQGQSSLENLTLEEVGNRIKELAEATC